MRCKQLTKREESIANASYPLLSTFEARKKEDVYT